MIVAVGKKLLWETVNRKHKQEQSLCTDPSSTPTTIRHLETKLRWTDLEKESRTVKVARHWISKVTARKNWDPCDHTQRQKTVRSSRSNAESSERLTVFKTSRTSSRQPISLLKFAPEHLFMLFSRGNEDVLPRYGKDSFVDISKGCHLSSVVIISDVGHMYGGN
ncbi:alpha/beta-hydrolase [Moniliophthora roreri]|nr:alpha/beta-hydrolase [Moniliophthora roreri]